MAFQPRQAVYYLDQSGNVHTGSFISQSGGFVTVSIAQGPPPVVVREIDAFATEVAAQRASVNRANLKSNRSQTAPGSFIKK
jgi:hypothetical protein